MSSWRIREIEREIEELERKLRCCSVREEYDIKKNIKDLKDELQRLKRKKRYDDEKDNDIDIFSSIIGAGIGSFIGSIDSGSSNEGFGGFGGGDSGGGGFGGDW